MNGLFVVFLSLSIISAIQGYLFDFFAESLTNTEKRICSEMTSLFLMAKKWYQGVKTDFNA